jgi:hypothetical protein
MSDPDGGKVWHTLKTGAPPDLLEAILERNYWNQRAGALGVIVGLVQSHRCPALHRLEWRPRRHPRTKPTQAPG